MNRRAMVIVEYPGCDQDGRLGLFWSETGNWAMYIMNDLKKVLNHDCWGKVHLK